MKKIPLVATADQHFVDSQMPARTGFVSCQIPHYADLSSCHKEPTRVTKSSATTIDLIFTNMVDNIATSGVIHLGISDHSLIYAVRKFAVPETRPTIKEVRNFKHFVEVDFINDLNGVSCQNVECFDDPNLA